MSASISRLFTCTNINTTTDKVTLTPVAGSTNHPDGDPTLLMTQIVMAMADDPSDDFWETDTGTKYEVLIERIG